MRLVWIAVFLLSGCGQSASEKASADVAFLEKNHASSSELCGAYTRLANAYRDEHNAKEWESAKFFQRNTCLTAELQARLRAEE